jgi:hypothetical protein
LTVLFLLLPACAYHFGLSERALPGGYAQVAVPMFKNGTAEVGIEPLFTDALIRRFNRSRVARVTDKDSAPVVLEGKILSVATNSESIIDNTQLKTLPQDTVLTTQYRLTVAAEIILRRKSDDRIIWQGQFSGEKVYSPPRLGTALVNSANATYNQSARMETFRLIAEEMMLEAHDRITENF